MQAAGDHLRLVRFSPPPGSQCMQRTEALGSTTTDAHRAANELGSFPATSSFEVPRQSEVVFPSH
jgi:hypothetical protein